MELLLLGLMGLGSLAFLIDANDDPVPSDGAGPDDRQQANPGTTTPPPSDTAPPAPPPPATAPQPAPAPAGRTFVLESGEPNPPGTAGNDTFTGVVEGTVQGGAGDDRFEFENGYGAAIYGGAGNDTLGSAGDSFTLHGDEGDDLIAFPANVYDGAEAYGGAGNDTLSIGIDDVPVFAAAQLDGGSGEDVFELDFGLSPDEGPGTAGLAVLKDFVPGTDRLEITAEGYSRAELVENADGTYTDLLVYQSGTDFDGSVVERVSTVRLMGVSGATLGSLGVTLPEPADSSGKTYLIDPGGLGFVDGGVGDDTISGIASGTFRGGGGDDTFLIEDGADSLIDGGTGNDVITVDAGANMTIVGGDGNDTLDIDSTDNIMETSVIDAGAGDDSVGIDIALADPSGSRLDTVSGGAGADVFTLNVTEIDYSDTFTSDQMLTIADFSETEDEIVVKLAPEHSPFFTGAELVEDPQGGWTDLLLSFRKTDPNGGITEWTGSIRLMDTSGLTLTDGGPIRVPTAA